MLLKDKHKEKLLEIAREHPADIIALSNYLIKVDLELDALEGEDKAFLKFCIVKGFASEISTLKKEESFEEAEELLKELKKLWEVLFDERANGKKEYIIFIGTKRLHTELDFGVNEMPQNPLESSFLNEDVDIKNLFGSNSSLVNIGGSESENEESLGIQETILNSLVDSQMDINDSVQIDNINLQEPATLEGNQKIFLEDLAERFKVASEGYYVDHVAKYWEYYGYGDYN